MSTTKLGLYNLALGTYIGTERLADLTEVQNSRYALDAVYDECLLYILEQGLWKFALRTAALTETVTPPTLTRQHSYLIPDDFVRLHMISGEPRLDVELTDYREANGVWYSDVEPIYVRYVSKDDDYGLNLDLYPENYKQALASWLAYQSVLPVSKDKGDRADLLRLHELMLSKARRLDAVDEPVMRRPAGRWPRVRGYNINGTTRGLR